MKRLTVVVRHRHQHALVFWIATLTLATGCDEKHPEVVATPDPVVLVSQPVERTVTDYQVFTARTQAVQSVDIKARVTGYLTKILFKDGADVKEGDDLFLIDERPYKATLDQANASLLLAKAALVKAQAEYDIGLNVQKQNAAAISDQDITKRLGARDEASASVKQADASLEMAQLNFNWCTVKSPISGRINTHFVDVGALVNQNVTTLTNIVSLKPMWAYFNVDQNTAERYQRLVKEGKVKAARETEIPVQMGLGTGQGFPIAGVIDFLSNQLDPNTGTIRLRAVFPNTDESLLAGFFARIKVPTSPQHPALLVNDQAIGTNQQQKFVMVVDANHKVEYREVEVGQLQADGLREVQRYRTVSEIGADGKEITKQVEVLKPTDWVIVEGVQRVRPGAKANPQEVDMVTLLALKGASKSGSANPK
jgi:RND family efflux transporter MFP subunit